MKPLSNEEMRKLGRDKYYVISSSLVKKISDMLLSIDPKKLPKDLKDTRNEIIKANK